MRHLKIDHSSASATTPLNFGSYGLRALSVLGGVGIAFWVFAFAWSAYRDPPPVFGIIALTILVAGGAFGILFSRYPSLLVVSDNTDWGVLLVRLFVGGAVSYSLLALTVYVVGWAAVVAAVAVGQRLEGEEGILVAILALWFPLWALPLSASATAWLWTRHRSRQMARPDQSIR